MKLEQEQTLFKDQLKDPNLLSAQKDDQQQEQGEQLAVPSMILKKKMHPLRIESESAV